MEQNNFLTPYQFRLATSKDTSALVELNFKWQADKISNAQKSDGFLSAQFNATDFETLIKNEEVIVTIHKDKVIGYYESSPFLVQFKSRIFSFLYYRCYSCCWA